MNLTIEQQEAVKTTANRVLVVAGAGSGKTRVLTERVGRLFDACNASPVEILAITFTRMAGQEMASRITDRLGIHGRRVEVGTLHGVALGMLKRFGEMVGFRPNSLSVYSEWQAQFLLEDCAVELGIKKGKSSWKVPRKDIKAAMQTLESTGVMPPEHSPIHALIKSFKRRCKENNACTYADLLTHFEMLIDLGVIDQYTSWRHVLVDEVQDMDLRQWGIIEKLSRCRTLFAVGDIRQSIYSFRGACPQYLFDRVSSFTVYDLTANFRSSAVIVEAANRLIENNGMVLGEPMVPAATVEDASPEVHVAGEMDSASLAHTLAHRFQEPVVVLSRVHGLLAKLSRELTERGIRTYYVGQDTATTRTEGFARLHAMFHLMANPFDNFSFLLARDLLGISMDDYRVIRKDAIAAGTSHFAALQARGFATDYPGPGTPLVEARDAIFKTMSYAAEDSDGLVASLNFMESVSRRFPTMTVEKYLEYLATLDVQDEMLAVKDFPQVTLMTVHASKGLEFDNVFIFGANEGILPDKRAVNDPDELESERRLAYVAMTRAIKRLVFVVRPADEKTGPTSRFVSEAIQ